MKLARTHWVFSNKTIRLAKKKIKIGHLRYILIIFCDCITLPTIFNDYIEANEILIQAFDQNADQTKHPDTLLVQIVSSQVP